MSPQSRRLFALLAAFLVWRAPVVSASPRLGLGLGVVHDCDTEPTPEATTHDCRRGVRGELSLDLASFSRSGGDGGGDREVRSSGSGSTLGHMNLNVGSGKDAAIIVGIVLVILLAYGLFWGAAALVSSEMTLGVYGSGDVFTKAATESLAREREGTLRRWGLQAGFYPVSNLPLRFHIGTGPASWHARGDVGSDVGGEGDDEDEDDARYREGMATKAGLGLVPMPGASGPFLLAEGEYLTLSTRTWKDLVNNNLPRSSSEYRLSTAVLGGFTWGW